MADIEVILPKMGESVAEATITTWLKKVGDKIEAEEALVEIATDKVDSEVPAPSSGTILKLLVAEGEVAKVGQAIAIIGANGASIALETVAPQSAASDSTPQKPVAKPMVETSPIEERVTKVDKPSSGVASGNRFYSPLVKSIAKEEGISLDQLESVAGTGKDGRVTKQDILGWVVAMKNGGSSALPTKKAETTATPASAQQLKPAASTGGDTEIIQMDRMRKLIAENMVKSKQISAHVTSFVEADVTNIVNWRNRVKNKFEQREGEKLTFTPIFIEAIVKAIKDFPLINISVEGDTIIRKKFINIGMAAALPSGNLIVPVIRNADRLNLLGLTKAVNDLADRARKNKLLPDEIQGGTYTISNVGSFGNVMGTPIIPQPQVAIMAVGAIKKKPAVIETEMGDTIGIRHFMFLSHSYDHRVVDGALGGMFVRKVADYLENWDINREL